jgi:hypothetical protein
MVRRESKIQKAIKEYLVERAWFVKDTHGNMYQSGFPDLYCCHKMYGPRWIECKLPNMVGSHFTAAQLITFPKMTLHGSGVWVLTAATDYEYKKLFEQPNWHQYLDVWRMR